jgi:hypothetical protein
MLILYENNHLAKVEQIIEVKISILLRSQKTHKTYRTLMALTVGPFKQRFDESISTIKTTKNILSKNLQKENKKKFSNRLETFIGFVVPASEIDALTGDITERYYKLKKEKGVVFARAWLANQIVISILRLF